MHASMYIGDLDFRCVFIHCISELLYAARKSSVEIENIQTLDFFPQAQATRDPNNPLGVYPLDIECTYDTQVYPLDWVFFFLLLIH